MIVRCPVREMHFGVWWFDTAGWQLSWTVWTILHSGPYSPNFDKEEDVAQCLCTASCFDFEWVGWSGLSLHQTLMLGINPRSGLVGLIYLFVLSNSFLRKNCSCCFRKKIFIFASPMSWMEKETHRNEDKLCSASLPILGWWWPDQTPGSSSTTWKWIDGGFGGWMGGGRTSVTPGRPRHMDPYCRKFSPQRDGGNIASWFDTWKAHSWCFLGWAVLRLSMRWHT